MRRLSEFTRAHLLLFRFLFVDGAMLLREVASAWDAVSVMPLTTKCYSFDRKIIDGYNERFAALKRVVQELPAPMRYSTLLPMLILVRVMCVAAAAFWGFALTFTVSLLQFVIAPYSFFAAIASSLWPLPQLFLHYLLFWILQRFTGVIFSKYTWLGNHFLMRITPTFILGCVIAEQVVCTIFLYWTPLGRPIRYSPKTILKSVVYGFVNAKTYWLVLLFSLRGFQLDLLAWFLALLIPPGLADWSAGLFKPVLKAKRHSTYAAVMVYHYHRMVHLPRIYAEAHLPHHHLHDATPFDAAMYGEGFPEQILRLMAEIAVSLTAGLMPFSLAPYNILASIGNKISHTRMEGPRPCGDNFHVNHHTRHVRNFGFPGIPIDLLLGTEDGDVSGLGNPLNSNVVCIKRTEPTRYILEVRPRESTARVDADEASRVTTLKAAN